MSTFTPKILREREVTQLVHEDEHADEKGEVDEVQNGSAVAWPWYAQLTSGS